MGEKIISIQGEDPRLWERFRGGDADAFAELYNKYAASLVSYGYRISKDEHAVKDSIQDLFIELWRSRKNTQPVQYIKSYLFKALRYKLLRHEKIRMLYTSEYKLGESLTDDISIDIVILKREEETETLQKIRSAVKTLSMRQQEAVILKFYHGFTNEQVAEIMGINYQSATNILHRALLILRRHFSLPVIILLSLFLIA